MKQPTNWPELFQLFRQQAQRMGLPRFAPTGHYLEQLERFILGNWTPGEDIPATETLPYGILLGDVIVKRFGAKWHYAEWTPGTITGDQVLAQEVRQIDKHGFCHQFLPVLGIGTFVAEPTKTLTSCCDFTEAIANGRLGDPENWKDGAVIDLGPDSQATLKEAHP